MCNNQENKKKIFVAGIVSYNPDMERFKENIENILNEVEKLVIVENGSKNNQKVKEIVDQYQKDRIKLIQNSENVGIAKALNQIMHYAEKEGFEWVITLDQDSVCPENLVSEYQKYIDEKNVAIICPQIQDRRRKYIEIENVHGVSEIDMCITSASCTNIKIWRKTGGFDNKLFIDLVDNEYCKKIRLYGYRILRLNYLILNHEFGDIEPKDTIMAKFFIKLSKILHKENIGKLSYKKKVYPLRVYYTCRNVIYLNKKYKKYGTIGYQENYHCHNFMGFIICFIAPSVLRADEKMEVFKAAIQGIKRGRILAKRTKLFNLEDE